MAEEEEELTIDDLEDDAEDVSATDTDGAEGSSEDPSWGPTIVVNNTTYAVSLFWQPLQDTSDPYPEVKETVENVMEGADLFCLRSGTSPQYGIGNSTEGHKAGMPSAAAAIAEIFQDKPSSVAVFEVDEGWWFIAVRNDLILSEEDILYLNEDDAKRAFYAMMAVPDWGRKIAPASWEIEGTEEVDLWDILKNPTSSKLMRINKASQKTKLMIAGAGLLVLFLGFKMISGMFTTQKKAVIRPLIPLPSVVEEETPLPTKEEVIVRPWEKLVVPEDLINRCQAAILQVKSIVVPGWKLGMISCTPSGLSTSWSMQWGNLGWIKRAFEEYSIRGLDFLIDQNGRTAIVSLSIGEVAVQSSAPKMMVHELQEEVTNFFQAINQPVRLKVNRPEIRQQVDEMGLKIETKRKEVLFPSLQFSFSSDLPIESWATFFNKFSALELSHLEYDPETNFWTYEGQIYEPVI